MHGAALAGEEGGVGGVGRGRLGRGRGDLREGGEDGAGGGGRGGALERHLLLVDARHGFFQEGGARGAVHGGCPDRIAGGAGGGEGIGRGGRGRVHGEDGGGCEGEEVVGPFLWCRVSTNGRKYQLYCLPIAAFSLSISPGAIFAPAKMPNSRA